MSIEEEIYNKLIEQFNIGEVCIKKYGKRKEVSWLEFISKALSLPTKELYIYCGFSVKTDSSYQKYFSRNFKNLMVAKNARKWKNWLLFLVNKKYCVDCCSILDLGSFNIQARNPDGLQTICKDCNSKYREENKENHLEYAVKYRAANLELIRLNQRIYYRNNIPAQRARGAKYRADKLQATPKWANLEKIREVYKSCPPGYHVDHIVPLKNDLVCGLHCEFNLQHLSAHENVSKGNRFKIT